MQIWRKTRRKKTRKKHLPAFFASLENSHGSGGNVGRDTLQLGVVCDLLAGSSAEEVSDASLDCDHFVIKTKPATRQDTPITSTTLTPTRRRIFFRFFLRGDFCMVAVLLKIEPFWGSLIDRSSCSAILRRKPALLKTIIRSSDVTTELISVVINCRKTGLVSNISDY